MASFEKLPGGKYRVQLCVAGKRKSKTFPSKREAQAWADAESVALRDKGAGVRSKHTLREALLRYAEQVSPSKRGERWEYLRLHAIVRSNGHVLPVDMPLTKLQPSHFALWRDSRLQKVKASTVLREITLLTHVLRICCREWSWLKTNPLDGLRRPTNPPHRDRVIADDEVSAIVQALGYDGGSARSVMDSVAVCFLLALETGMRAGELCGLTWNRVHNRKVVLDVTKNGRGREVPLSTRAVDLLGRMRGVDQNLVFGLRSSTLDALFRRARMRAGMQGFTFHDARHTAATKLALKVDVLTLCKIFGWTSPKMAMVYYNPKAEDVALRLD